MVKEKKENVEETKEVADTASEEEVKKTTANKKTLKKKNYSKDMIVKIISNFDGKVGYTSPNKMVSFEIDDYGGYEYVELSTLMAMRNGNRRYFEENWILIDDGDDYTAEEIYKFLRVEQYYKTVFKPDNIDKLFSLEAKRIEEIVSNYSNTFKQTIFRLAKKRYKEGKLDSVAKVKAIEKATGYVIDED